MLRSVFVFVLLIVGTFVSVNAGSCRVTASALNVRSGPGTNYGKVGLVRSGNTLTNTGSSGVWKKIRMSNGREGWVHGNYVSCSGGNSGGNNGGNSGGSTTTKCVQPSALNFRSGPGTNYGKVGTLSRGTRVTVHSTSGGWSRITANGRSGYVSAQYLGNSCSSGGNNGGNNGGGSTGGRCGLSRKPLSSYRVTSGFGHRCLNGRCRNHNGIDLAVASGTSVYAAHAGTCRVQNFDRNGYGNWVMVVGNGVTTVYAHLSSTSACRGSVSAGAVIGRSGNTGASTGPHLHFEVHQPGWRNAKNPASCISF